MIGISTSEWLALGSAFLWALNGTIIRSQSAKISPAAINAIRCGASAVLFWLIIPFDTPEYSLSVIPWIDWFWLFASVITNIVIGDTFYLVALKELGVSRSLALSGTFPLTTLLFEYFVLGSAPDKNLAFGAFLVVIGVALLSQRSASVDEITTGGRTRIGIAFALGASILWGLGVVLLKPALMHVSLIQANAVRMPLVVVLLFAFRIFPVRKTSADRLDFRTFAIIAASGVLGMGLGSWMFLAAVVDIGPARTATLTSIYPVFGLVLAVLFLKERLSVSMAFGVAACVMGVWVVV